MPTPVLSDSERGTFKVESGTIILTPAKKKEGKSSYTPVTATVSGDQIKATYVVQSGNSHQRVTLTLRRDPSYW